MPDADGPPVSDNPPFIDYGGQFNADAEILQTVAEKLLQLGEGDLGENVESIAKRMQEIWTDSLFGLIDPVLHEFAETLRTDQEFKKTVEIAHNDVNRYLMVRDVMDLWRTFVNNRRLSSALMVDRNRLLRWITDLQSGVYVNCVYCGHRYGPYGEKTPQETLTAHVESCPKHPLAAAKKRIAELEDLLSKEKNDDKV